MGLLVWRGGKMVVGAESRVRLAVDPIGSICGSLIAIHGQFQKIPCSSASNYSSGSGIFFFWPLNSVKSRSEWLRKRLWTYLQEKTKRSKNKSIIDFIFIHPFNLNADFAISGLGLELESEANKQWNWNWMDMRWTSHRVIFTSTFPFLTQVMSNL